MKKRSTQFELMKRNEMIRDLIFEGLSHKEIVAHILDTQNWGVGSTTIKEMIRSMEKKIKLDISGESGDSLTTTLARLERLYADAVKRGDLTGALRATELRAKISGLIIDKKEKVTTEDKLPEINTQQLLRLLKWKKD